MYFYHESADVRNFGKSGIHWSWHYIQWDQRISLPIHAAAFNEATVDWVVISRVRLTKQDHSAYRLAFSFEKCKADNCSFEPGKSLLAVVTDWSDSEVHGLCDTVGEEVGQSLIHGCHVHWNCSWQRIRDRISCSKDKNLHKCIIWQNC